MYTAEPGSRYTMLELQTWYYNNGLRWSESQKYETLDQLEKDLMTYKLSENLGYKIFENGNMKKQWFNKTAYRGAYNDTTTT